MCKHIEQAAAVLSAYKVMIPTQNGCKVFALSEYGTSHV